jgi:hypothetical protein
MIRIEVTQREPTEHAATLPNEISGSSRECELAVASSTAVTIDAIAVVPLSDDLAPPPPEPWRPSAEESPPASPVAEGPPRN